MNLRQFTIGVPITTLLLSNSSAFAAAGVALDKGDFVAAEKISRDGETVISARIVLARSGRSMLR